MSAISEAAEARDWGEGGSGARALPLPEVCLCLPDLPLRWLAEAEPSRPACGTSWVVRVAGYLWVSLIAVGCTPLIDLDLYSSGGSDPNTGGSSGDGDVQGGQAGESNGVAPVCGNGTVDFGEECDDAGMSLACGDDCRFSSCPEDCECEMFEGSYLVLCPEPIRFAGAKQNCNNAGFGFDIPVNRREQEFIQAWSSRVGIESLWLGGSDALEDDVWVTGTGITYWEGLALGEPIAGVYVNWRPGQPDNFEGDQQCMSQGITGGWDDEACNQQYAYFCSRRPLERSGCGDGVVAPQEVCDAGGLTSKTCDRDCTRAVCGDSVTNQSAGEDCDDGNQNDFDACSNNCKKSKMVAYFPLHEKAGKRAWDLASMTHHGDLQGGAAFASSGEGLVLDGLSHFVRVPSGRAPMIKGEITLMALVEASLPLPTTPIYQDLITQTDADQETFLRLRGASLQGGSWWSTALNAAEYSLSDSWEEEAFHHVAARYDGTAWTLFHDGEKVMTTEGAVGALSEAGSLNIGGRDDGRYFAGTIRDVRLYDVALADEEIEAVAEYGLGEL